MQVSAKPVSDTIFLCALAHNPLTILHRDALSTLGDTQLLVQENTSQDL